MFDIMKKLYNYARLPTPLTIQACYQFADYHFLTCFALTRGIVSSLMRITPSFNCISWKELLTDSYLQALETLQHRCVSVDFSWQLRLRSSKRSNHNYRDWMLRIQSLWDEMWSARYSWYQPKRMKKPSLIPMIKIVIAYTSLNIWP